MGKEIIMAGFSRMCADDFSAVTRAYQEQIAVGNSREMAVNIATIVYQQRHPFEIVEKSRVMVGAAVAAF